MTSPSRHEDHGSSKSGRALGFLCFAGLGSLTSRELKACGATDIVVKRLPGYDLVLAELAAGVGRRVGQLRTIEDAFWMLGRPFKLEGSRPVPLAKAITAEAVLQGLSLKNAMFPGKKPRTPTYNCFVKQDHDYAFFRRSLTEQLAEILGAAFPHWRRADPGAVEIWGFLIESHLYLGLRLSSHALRYRGQDPAQRAAALRPTVAAAMVLVGAPMPGERVLDPMCGTGTILAEALAREPGVTLAGGDVDPEAVRCARARLANVAADICEWNAASLPVAPGSVDCIISNLPWGHTYASVGGNRQLYAALLREWAAKLKPSGRMVLLSDDAGALTEAAAGAGLRMTEEHEVRVLGRWATLRRLHKRATANG